ncbi:MAG: preprotein translocase subunit SecA, partial [Firmicutes bacterium]|nr:preprotein translocase subunit SecA [Bacillota bacterium]
EKDILPEAFAVVREAAKRVLGMRHFDVQLIGGMVLHDGRIAEMRTGEGKTLVATAPVYLNALSGKGVHVITVNDYLATRDSEWMGRVYRFLGLSVGLIVHDMTPEAKKAAYAADITYGTNNEFGFDFLRDNMAVFPEQCFQRGLNFAIVDEVDSILIDEARTPLIISGPSDKPTELYYEIARLIPRLKAEEDYNVDEKAKTVALTESGVAKMENYLHVENLFDPENTELAHYVNQGLKAHALFKRDRDYVIKEGKVIIVDEFTGRLMFGRRYSEGVHQSIEAKENVKIERESQTLATITFQNYFRMYDKLAGMTGTAATEENEFREIYKLDVVQIPTNLPMQRVDMPDAIYRTQKGKLAAVINDIENEHAKGRPVLVGTVSIEKSEELSNMLKKRGIKHQVLNAKFHEKEAQIVAQAGREGAVTIATNMAGRGTDILLGGSYEMMAQEEMQANAEHEYSDAERLELLDKYKKQTKAEHDRVVKAGGLHIIGTERHDSRRIDNQLRGRAGRQGDPGSSQFYLSMEDDLMRLFGGDGLGNMMDKVGMDDSMPIAVPIVSKSMETAQKRVENRNFEARKHVLDYDNVMNEQREVIYSQRRRALNGENLSESVYGMLEDVINRAVKAYAISDFPEEWDMQALLTELDTIVIDKPSVEELLKLDKDEVAPLLIERAKAYMQKREQEIGTEMMQKLQRWTILRSVDNKWMAHLDAMDQMRQGIGLRAYGQSDPLVEYKFEAYEMFNQMTAEIQESVIRLIMIARIEPAAPAAPRPMVENRGGDGSVVKKPARRDEKEVGRNELCPCGSGLKYKKCCGKDK